jgi:hypothetical protein
LLSPTASAAGTWFDALLAKRAAALASTPERAPRALPDMGRKAGTVLAWIRMTGDGAIFAKTNAKGPWVRHGKGLFVRGGRLAYDIGWVGCVQGRSRVSDGKWHHIAFVCGPEQAFFVDGKADGEGNISSPADPKGAAFKIGHISSSFPFGGDSFRGEIDDVKLYGRRLSDGEIRAAFEGDGTNTRGLIAHWPFDGDVTDASGGRNDLEVVGRPSFTKGRRGEALKLGGRAHVRVIPAGGKASGPPWDELASQFRGEAPEREMAWEREDCIWGPDWRSADAKAIGARYADSIDGPGALVTEARGLAERVRTDADLARLRAVYLKSRKRREALAALGDSGLGDLRGLVDAFHSGGAESRALLRRLERLEARADGLAAASDMKPADVEAWKRDVTALRGEIVVTRNPLVDFDKIVFIKRLTYSANHYYTEFINARWTPGGGLCVLSLKDGSVRELAPSLEGGVFMRFDVSFDAKRVVFDWKCADQEGYRIYEVNVDGTGLRQLTFPEENEKELQRLYRARAHYHHGTDDMHPCYLPGGDICFISTRCQYGILCDAPDDFTTTILYRMDPDGRNMRPLTNSSVSEASPVMLPDGRIMYTRWEYADKGAVSVKCLWAMRPDGSASAEVYGNDISLPPTMIYGRPIPGAANKYVFVGTPHCPQNGVGTVIRLDMNRDIRTRDPMDYMTPYVDIKAEGGFAFREGDGPWRRDGSGTGPLFRDPYPLSEKLFMVAHKPAGTNWRDTKGYGLYLLDEKGNTYLVHKDPEISCWQPFPLRPRRRPPVLESPVDERMAAKGLATCVVTDIYHGMEDTPRGSIKYIRVLEQVPRPWATRRRWGGDGYDQQHATITKDTHLGLKVQHGVVPVEDDGSAHFVVPAMKNIIFQALDKNYMAVQTERTYVNYVPGESRSCIGCHETPNDAAAARDRGVVKALRRAPSVPGPQPGEKSGKRPLDFAADVQPVLDRHCVKCHSGEKPKAGLDLSGRMTSLFSVSYESLIPERRRGKGRRRFELVGPTIGENHPKTGNVHYMPARSFGSHNSVLVAMHSKGKVRLKDPQKAEIAARLAEKHKDVKLRPEELLKITNWVDTNSQFYGMYWGRKNLQHKDHPNFRPVPTFERAASYVSQIPEDAR